MATRAEKSCISVANFDILCVKMQMLCFGISITLADGFATRALESRKGIGYSYPATESSETHSKYELLHSLAYSGLK